MDKYHMEVILPAQINIDKGRKMMEPQIILSDLLHVNPIVDSRKLKSKKKLSPTRPARNLNRNPKFENRKQEQHYRLNRENKLQRNNEWAEVIKKNSIENNSSVTSKSLTAFQKLAETNRHVDEATVQLEEINAFIEAKKNNFTTNKNKNLSKPVKNSDAKSNSQIKHLCTKEIYSEKLDDIDSMMKYLDKNMKIKEQISSKQRDKNSSQKKKINETLGLMNTKLSKVKEKYFNNDFETNHINSIINKKPKYRSVKELMKLDRAQLSTMEASKIIKADLDNDINNLSDSDLFKVPKNSQIEVLFENVDVIKKESFQDNFSDELRTEELNSNKKVRESPKLLHEGARKYLNSTLKTTTPIQDTKVLRKRIEVDTQTPTTSSPNKLERSVLKSEYLMKEFGLDSSKYVLPNIENTSINNKSKKPWNKELEYFMT